MLRPSLFFFEIRTQRLLAWINPTSSTHQEPYNHCTWGRKQG